jgi:hypothetical protein
MSNPTDSLSGSTLGIQSLFYATRVIQELQYIKKHGQPTWRPVKMYKSCGSDAGLFGTEKVPKNESNDWLLERLNAVY